MDATAAGVGVTEGGGSGEVFFLFGVDELASLVDCEPENSFKVVFPFLESWSLEGNKVSGDVAFLFRDFGTVGGNEAMDDSEGTAFFFLLTLSLDPAEEPFLLIVSTTFATGDADIDIDAVSDNFSLIREAALKRADRLVDIIKYLDDCKEQYLVNEGFVLNDRTRCSLITEL